MALILVHTQSSGTREPTVTCLADEGTRPGVQLHVIDQIATSSEHLSARITLIRPFSRMHPGMGLQIRELRERLATIDALVRPFSTVNPHVAG